MMLFFTVIGVIATAVSGFITWHNWYQSQQIPYNLAKDRLNEDGDFNLILDLGYLEHSNYTVEKIALAPDDKAIISCVDDSDILNVSAINVGWIIPSKAASSSSTPRRYLIAIDRATTDTVLLLTIFIPGNLLFKRHNLRIPLNNLKRS